MVRASSLGIRLPMPDHQNKLSKQTAYIGPGAPVGNVTPSTVGTLQDSISKIEKCFLCLQEVAAGENCRELRCNCRVVAHVDCLESWWEQTAPSRPEREVKLGVLQLECPKCGKNQRIPRKFENWGIQIIKGKKENEWV
eukprot:Skav224389  [mRNA]  locus=scaffold2452:6166:8555:- [translate_table: standard]